MTSEKLLRQLGLFALISVVFVTGNTTTPSSDTTTTSTVVQNNNMAVDQGSTSPATTTPDPTVTTTSAPVAGVEIQPAADSSSNGARDIPAAQADASGFVLETTTLSNLFTGDTTSTTATDSPPRPEDSNINANVDPDSKPATPIMSASTTQAVLGTTLPPTATTSAPDVVNSDQNPYNNIPHAQLQSLNLQQQQQLFNPWFFMNRNYPPFYMLQRNQAQQGSPGLNMPANNLAPLYMTAMDMELWPLLLAQQRGQQQSQQQQVPTQGTANQNIAPTNQDQRLPQQIQNRNNLANTWFFLNEL